MAPRERKSFRSSILVEILVSLVAILIVAVGTTSLLEARLAGNALTRQSQVLAAGRLSVLVEGYNGRERTLRNNLRYIAERFAALGLTQPARRNLLIAELGATIESLELSVLEVVFPNEPPLAVNPKVIDPSEISEVPQIGLTIRSRLVRTTGNEVVQALAARIGVSDVLLVGGVLFSDPFAFAMRQAMGGDGETVLVADGKVVGTTISENFSGEIPGRKAGDDSLPATPIDIEFEGRQSKVAYIGIGRSEPTTTSALGVIFVDPVTSLNRSLAGVRIVSSIALTLIALLTGWFLFKRVISPLVGLSNTAERIAGGDLGATFSAPRKDEIGRLASSLQQMTAELQAKTTRLQEASKRLLGAEENERRRLARNLHDGMQQQLVALAIKLRRASGATSASVDHNALDILADDAENAAFALQELGRGISPTVLADQGLYAALRAAAGRLPMQVVLKVAEEMQDARFGPDVEGTLYYVALEAMTNAQKHAPDSVLTIELSLSSHNVELRVSDDGPGFNVVRAHGNGQGAGLQNMQDRISAQGGTITLSSKTGAGTTIYCTIPLLAGSTYGGALPQVDENGGNPSV